MRVRARVLGPANGGFTRVAVYAANVSFESEIPTSAIPFALRAIGSRLQYSWDSIDRRALEGNTAEWLRAAIQIRVEPDEAE